MALMDRLYDQIRHPAAFEVRPQDARAGSLKALEGARFSLLVTFRRDGAPVPTPVWMAVDGRGHGYLKTGASSGKVKRIRANPEVLVTASSARGKPRGPLLKARGVVLGPDDWPHAEQALASAFGLPRRAYTFVFKMSADDQAYVEIEPEGHND